MVDHGNLGQSARFHLRPGPPGWRKFGATLIELVRMSAHFALLARHGHAAVAVRCPLYPPTTDIRRSSEHVRLVPEADITKIKRKRKQQNWLLNWIVTAHGTQQGLALLAILRQPKPSTAPAISPLATINF
jgi:hypothetical protein